MTADPPGQVAVALAALRPVADEIVVAADSRVDVGALRAYDGVADRVVRFEFRPPVDRPRAWLATQCSGDWLLSIDGDEVPSRALLDALPGLTSAADVQQCWLPRRWLFPDATSWLAEAPWWPDFQVRLLRNDASLAARAELHGGFVGVLPARHVDAPLYHLDALVNAAATRRRQGGALRGRGPGSVGVRRWAAQRGHVPARAVGVGRHPPRPRGGPRPDRPGPRRPGPRRGTGTVAGHAGDSAVPPVVPAAEIDAVATSPSLRPADYAVALRLFEATDGDAPLRLAPGRPGPLYVRVENRGDATWRWGLDQQPLVRVSHHWRTPGGDVTRYEGLRSPLPCTLGPGGVDRRAGVGRGPRRGGRPPARDRPRPRARALVRGAADRSGRGGRAPAESRDSRTRGRGAVLITTVVARNYLAQARVLARTFLGHHPGGRVVVLVLDAPGEGLRDDEPFEVVVPTALFPPDQQRELRRMTAIYNVMELATALKPFLLRHLLAAGAPSVTYLDPDIEVFAPLDDVAGAAERHGIVLTPHRLTPVPADGRQPDERAFLVSGAYNLGFVAVGPAGAGFLDWWADRCGRDCLHDVPDGLFVDQRWVDVAAAYFPPLVLRDPGLNVAYWNVDERPIEATPGGGHRAGGAPLRFLHYSGYDPDAGHQLTRYHEGRPRVLLSEDPALRALCAAYGERLRAEGWDECRKLDYGLAFAANGMVLDGLMRRIVRQELLRRERTLEHDAGDVDAVPDPYEPGEVDAFVALLRSPFPGSAAPRISRYLHALHHSRPDLQSACPHLTGPSGNHFLAWIRSIGQRDLGLPPEVIPAADEIEGDVGAPAERPAGVRLVGYLDAELGMGELGRGLLSALRAAGEPVVTATETVTLSRRRHDAGVRDGEDGGVDGATTPMSTWSASTPTGCPW